MPERLTSGDPFRFFDAIYCINLDSRPDRWQEAVREFTLVGIADRVVRVAGITHADPREGCRLSHMECVRRAEAADAQNVLIFEDDVVFRGFSTERLARSLDRLRAIADWELFYLGGYVLTTPEDYGDLLRVPMAMTHAYVIHRRAFAAVRNSTSPYDVWLAMNMRSYCAHPLLALQRDGFSDLENVWIQREGQEIYAYHQFVARPKGERLVRAFLRRRLRWRLLRIRLQRRFERSRQSIVSALGFKWPMLGHPEGQGDSPPAQRAKQ